MSHVHVEVVKSINLVTEKLKMEITDILEYSLLHANVTKEEISSHCAEAIKNKVYAVCIPPYYVAQAKQNLENSPVKIVTVCGFPFGYGHTVGKVEDVKKSLSSGADEIDLVLNFAAVKSEDWKTVKNDISSIATLCQMQDKKCKVILEVSLLSEKEILEVISICEENGVDYLKTGTGVLGEDVTAEEIEFLRKSSKLKIKASGGIKSKIRVTQLVQAGADVIGSSKLLK